MEGGALCVYVVYHLANIYERHRDWHREVSALRSFIFLLLGVFLSSVQRERRACEIVLQVKM